MVAPAGHRGRRVASAGLGWAWGFSRRELGPGPSAALSRPGLLGRHLAASGQLIVLTPQELGLTGAAAVREGQARARVLGDAAPVHSEAST